MPKRYRGEILKIYIRSKSTGDGDSIVSKRCMWLYDMFEYQEIIIQNHLGRPAQHIEKPDQPARLNRVLYLTNERLSFRTIVTEEPQ